MEKQLNATMPLWTCQGQTSESTSWECICQVKSVGLYLHSTSTVSIDIQCVCYGSPCCAKRLSHCTIADCWCVVTLSTVGISSSAKCSIVHEIDDCIFSLQ